ncbi:MAG: amidohydrolase family protein [Deltaproteobacteria bacterium]|nr:amidohydrolase family protein [Deltaproteobacteria bacterium]
MRALPLAALALVACAGPEPAPAQAADGLVLEALAPGGAPLTVWLRSRQLGDPAEAGPGVPRRALPRRYLAPAVVDAHAHLTYVNRTYGPANRCPGLPEPCTVQDALLQAGVAAAVDLASPLDALPTGRLRVAYSGPMLTAPGGYPTNAWGYDGYGWPLETPEQAEAAVERLAELGVRVLKLPLDTGPALATVTASAAVARAHRLGMTVAAHAPTVAAVEAALALGVDLLAHAPVEPISDALAARWAPRAVVGTLSSFSSGAAAQANLQRLAAAGARVLYGTDLGNGNRPGISAAELAGLTAALGPAGALEAATAAPAAYFGFDDLGALVPGKAACVLVLAEDPSVDPTALARPLEVLGEGCAAY